MKTRFAHRIFSLLLSLVMLLSMVIVPAKALDELTPSGSIADVSTGYTYAKLIADLEALKTAYAETIGPDRLQFTSIGSTVLGRDIPAVILGNQNAPQKLYVQGALQASDSLSSAFVVKQLESYLARYAELSSIFDNAAIAFVPMVNPDGVTLATEGEEVALSVLANDEQKAAYSAAIAAARALSVTNDPNGGEYEGASYWNANINGVDLYYNFFNRAMIYRGSNGQDGSSATSASGSLGNYLVYHNQKGAKLLSARAYGSYGTSSVASSADSTDACAQPESAAVKAFLLNGGYTAALDYGSSFVKDSNDKERTIHWDYKLDEYFPKEGGVLGDERLSTLAAALSEQTGYSLAGGIGPKGFPAWFQTETNGKFAARVNLSDDFDAAFTSCKDASLFVLTYCMNTTDHPMGFEISLSEMKEVESSVLTGDSETGRYTYTQMMSDIEALKARYTDLVNLGLLTVKAIGTSELGRSIPAVILGNRQAEYKLYVQGAAQATEYQNALLLMKQIEYYCANMDSGFNGGSKLADATLRDTFANTAIAFVPMANPDGVMLVLEGYGSLNEAGLNLSDARKAEIAANCEALLKGADVSKWDSNINGIDVYYNVYTQQMATTAGSKFYTTAKKAPSYTSGASCNTAFGEYGMRAAESAAIGEFITGERFNLLLDYQLGGTTSKFSNGGSNKDLRWAVSDMQMYGLSPDEDIAQRKAFNTLSDALASFTGYNNAAIHTAYNESTKKWSGRATGGLSARALDGWFQVTFPGSFGCVLDNASCTGDTFAQTWEKRKDASLFLLRYAEQTKLVAPIDRSMDIGEYESVVDTENQKYDYYDIKDDLAALAEQYGSLVESGMVTFTSVGKTELGRDIPVVIIGNRSSENKLYVMGNEHAREDINARLVVKQIELYLEMLQNHSTMLWQWDYKNGGVDLAGVTWGDVFRNNCIALVPTANPDGLQLIHEGRQSLYHDDCTGVTDAEKEAIWANVEALAVKKYANLKAEEGYIDGRITDPDTLNQQVFYTEDGQPYNYTLWKSNIKGIDIFYNFYDWNQYNLGNDYPNDTGGQLTTLSSFLSYWKARAAAGKEIDYYSPSSETSYGTFGMMAAEVRAIAGFIMDEGFNMAITYHNRGPVLKWDYRLGTYYPASSGVNGSGWSGTIKEICTEIAKPSGYSVSTSGSPPAGFVAWFQTSHVNGFSVNVETGYGTFNGVFDASPLRVAQFKDIWEGNKYGPVIALTYCAYNDDTLIPTVSAYRSSAENYWENYWPDFTVQYGWSGDAPDGLTAPADDTIYSYDQYLTGSHLTTVYVPGYQCAGAKDGVNGTWTFNGWDFNGWIRGQAIMDYVGSWGFTASTPTPAPDPVPDPAPVVPETPSKTETITNSDGSVTKIETKLDGTVIETTTAADGTKTVIETKTTTDSNGTTTKAVIKTVTAKDGSKTESMTEVKTAKDGTSTEVTKITDVSGSTGATTTVTDAAGNTAVNAEVNVSTKAAEEAKKTGMPALAPVEVKAAASSENAPVVRISIPKSAGEIKVEIPVTNLSSGTVAVLVHADGTEEILKTCTNGTRGVILNVSGDVSMKIIDNSRTFADTANHWSRDEVSFVVSRGIFNGVGDGNFGVSAPMTRGMVNTVLARLAGVNTAGGANWYDKGNEWAIANGVSDGTNPTVSVTREQLATMLYRFAGSPAVSGTLSFTDAGSVSSYARSALLWASQIGIINGLGDGSVAPASGAERAQVAAMLARYIKLAG